MRNRLSDRLGDWEMDSDISPDAGMESEPRL